MQNDKIIFAKDEPHVVLPHKEYLKHIQEAYKKGAEDVTEAHMNVQQVKNEAKNEAKITVEKEKEEVKQRFQDIAARQETELLRAKTIFPIDFFPDTIVIDTTKLTICNKQFFATEYITTIPLKDISDVTLQTAFFMAGITIKYMPQASSPGMNHTIEANVSSLWRQDAIKAKNILKGVMVAKAEDIDISKLPPKEVATVIEQFGHSEGVV
jgi:hypothetical protein